MAGRIYVVENDNTASLVRAVSAAKALNFVVQEQYKVRVASVEDVASYMGMGATVEDAVAAEIQADPAVVAEGEKPAESL